ncbi:Molybdate metabolism regulator [Labilithrix luteola]|uniref:Molybdate metabolism regulator n=1 Tax=Labilithrix luteola TaxID=1391654 RepID=A0A0K1Q735_9BACT|nr:DUF4132 domain-containing protein [Labilithrix luteola]AKV01548.1 Molybdate metabolism regulator [Labilithrix luteola]
MRRFELAEGTSNKFWQAVVNGTDLVIQWGRIGTAGQSQTKSFGSEGGASQELAKLVREKTKKGYVEVARETAQAAGTGDSAKPAVEATPKATEKKAKKVAVVPQADAAIAPPTKAEPPNTADAITWTDELRRCCRTLDGAPSGETEEAIVEALKAHNAELDSSEKVTRRQQIKNGAKHTTPALHTLAMSVATTYGAGKIPSDHDHDRDAAAALFGPTAMLVEAWYADGGVTRLAEILARTTRMQVGETGSAIYLEGASSPPDQELVEAVRALVARATDGERAAVRAILEPARASAPSPDARLLFNLAMNSRELAEEDARAFLDGTKMSYRAPRHLFALVRDPALCAKLAAKAPSDVPVYDLARDLGWEALPSIIIAFERDTKNTWVAEALAMFESLTAAKALALALAEKRTAPIAKAYYERRPDLAVSALASIAGGTSKLVPFAKGVYEEALRKTGASKSDEPAVAKASADNVPKVFLSPPAGKPLPDFLEGARLPALVLANGKGALPESARLATLRFLRASTLDAPAKEIAQIAKACTAASLAAFAWALFEAWLASGVGSKENWAFTALGLLGDDDTARRLTPFIRSWPGESQHARAGVGLDILGAIGTDVALMHLDGVAQKVKYKALQERAREKIGVIANARGLTAEELGDRLASDLGLGPDGSLVLDFGPRQFKVGFDEELQPFVLDASNKRIGALPKPTKTDDANLASEATERWKTLKKDAKAIAALQLRRLELAMSAQRRWSFDLFKMLFVGHPLIGHVTRRLVWGVYKGDKLLRTFRVAEDRTFADENDDTSSIESGALIGLPHRLELDDTTVAAWGKVLGDYEIVQPFDQLGRPTFLATPKELGASGLKRKMTVKTSRIRGLEDRGWRKGSVEDAGWVWNIWKPLSGGVRASISLGGGLCMGWAEGTPSEQEVTGPHLEDKATFGRLSKVAFSELVLDFESLRD